LLQRAMRTALLEDLTVLNHTMPRFAPRWRNQRSNWKISIVKRIERAAFDLFLAQTDGYEGPSRLEALEVSSMLEQWPRNAAPDA
jgi:hypothetical protein